MSPSWQPKPCSAVFQPNQFMISPNQASYFVPSGSCSRSLVQNNGSSFRLFGFSLNAAGISPLEKVAPRPADTHSLQNICTVRLTYSRWGDHVKSFTDNGEPADRSDTILNSSHSGSYLCFGAKLAGYGRAFGNGQKGNGPQLYPFSTLALQITRSLFWSSGLLGRSLQTTVLFRSPTNGWNVPSATVTATSATTLSG